MYRKSLVALAAALTSWMGLSSPTLSQSPKGATYITDEEVKTVNATPGIDRTIRVVDIGNENFAIAIIRRVSAARGAARGTGAAPAGRAESLAAFIFHDHADCRRRRQAQTHSPAAAIPIATSTRNQGSVVSRFHSAMVCQRCAEASRPKIVPVVKR
jgi:hypothetical protein